MGAGEKLFQRNDGVGHTKKGGGGEEEKAGGRKEGGI